MSKDKQIDNATRDLKKLIGNPKIIFVLGGPASGKGTQCEKMVEEFGYTHISTGDLMRLEMQTGSKEGDRIKKIVADGGLVPYELTVQILVNGMIAKPSKNYLIDGFPRAVDQAQYFEQNVLETQQVLYYNVPQDIMVERCLKRAETSGRSDDNPDTIKKRVQNYFDQSLPVIDYYKRFGKVFEIDATGDVGQVYQQTKNAILPQTMFILGPKASGKSKIAEDMAARSNMNHINFNDFVEQNGLKGKDDETISYELVQSLSREMFPRVIIEHFPQNLFQAKYFLRNCKQPSHVFSLKCSKDVSQDRMNQLGESHPDYISSGILAKKIKQYHETAKELLPYLKQKTNFFDIDAESNFPKVIEEVNKLFEPTVIHIRPGANSNELRKEITERLVDTHGFMNLDINFLIRDENERKTSIGQEMHAMVQGNRIIPAEMIVRMLKKIIYCGQPSLNKFILSSFPDIIEQAREFEQNCAKIAAIIYSTNEDSVVEIKNNNLSLFNIDSLFQKEFRLKTMTHWDSSIFNEKLGNKIVFGLIVGQSLTGKTKVAEYLQSQYNFKVIDMKLISEKVKSKLGTEEEPFEGEVPVKEVEKEIKKIIDDGSKSKVKFIFDGYSHKSHKEFIDFTKQFGVPEFLISMGAPFQTIKERLCRKNEVDDIGEEQAEELKSQCEQDKQTRQEIITHYEAFQGRCMIQQMDASQSFETISNKLKSLFSPMVIILNHEKRLGIDVTCANLAIKFNMLYLSAYQLIKQHIENNTEWGKKLILTKRNKLLNLTTQVRDEFQESEFSPALFDQGLVMELLKQTVTEKRSTERYVILEGLCNTGKLTNVDDKYELRLMDEYFDIQMHIGDVAAIIGLQFSYEPEIIEEKEIEYEKFDIQVTQEKKEVKVEEGEEPPAEDGAPKKEVFRPEEWKWTVSNRKSKNLPQLFLSTKGADRTMHEVKTAEQYSSSQYEAISRSLDEFCQRVCNEGVTPESGSYIYQQIIFSE